MKIDGKELLIHPAKFKDAFALKMAVAKSLKGSNTDIKGDSTTDTKTLITSNFNVLIDAVLSVDTSEEVSNALFRCANKAVFNNQKVNEDFFEDVDNREYYYPIMIEVLKVNLLPFFKNLSS